MKSFFVLLVLSVTAAAQAGKADLNIVVSNGRYGYIRADGSLAISPKYLFAREFQNGKATVWICGTAVSIDADEHVSPIEETDLQPRSIGEGEKRKMGFANRNGPFVIPPAYDDVWEFSDGLAAVSIDDKWGYVDKTGKLVIPMIFDLPGYFADGRAVVALEDSKALIDRNGNVVRGGFSDASYAPPGRLSAVEREDKWGYINRDGTTVIPFRYEAAEDFSDGLAAVSYKSKWGFVNESGVLLVPHKFDKVGRFFEGLAWARAGKKTGYINKQGRFEFVLDSESGNDFGPSGLASFFTKDWKRFGYVNRQGHVVWGPTSEMPSHPPLFGWTQEEIDESCEGFPEAIKSEVEKIGLGYH